MKMIVYGYYVAYRLISIVFFSCLEQSFCIHLCCMEHCGNTSLIGIYQKESHSSAKWIAVKPRDVFKRDGSTKRERNASWVC